MNNINEVVIELLKFSKKILTLHKPVNPKVINDFENKFKLKLPEDYKILLNKTNGFDLFGNEVFGMYIKKSPSDLEYNYLREHNNVKVPMYNHLIPFLNDGSGNFYCFDTKTMSKDKFECKIVFWYSNYLYDKDTQPEIVNESFAEWMKEVIIDWTLEDYDYDGNRI